MNWNGRTRPGVDVKRLDRRKGIGGAVRVELHRDEETIKLQSNERERQNQRQAAEAGAVH